MQGQIDADRTKFDDRDYSVVCFQCGNTFEATRSDASFCSAKCRMAHSREPQKLANALEDLKRMNIRVFQIAEKYKGNSAVVAELERLKKAVGAAEFIAEFMD